MMTGHYPGRVSPFGYLWINAYLRLPKAFRSLSRPSSAISALASTLRSSSLDLCLPLGSLLRLSSGTSGTDLFYCCVFIIFMITSSLRFESTSDHRLRKLSLALVIRLYFSLCSFQGALVGWSGLEPPTSRLSGECSNRLSYQPICGGD